MKKSTEDRSTFLKFYSCPQITVELISLEHSVAAGSATVTPVNNQSQVRQEWETAPDVVGNQAW